MMMSYPQFAAGLVVGSSNDFGFMFRVDKPLNTVWNFMQLNFPRKRDHNKFINEATTSIENGASVGGHGDYDRFHCVFFSIVPRPTITGPCESNLSLDIPTSYLFTIRVVLPRHPPEMDPHSTTQVADIVSTETTSSGRVERARVARVGALLVRSQPHALYRRHVSSTWHRFVANLGTCTFADVDTVSRGSEPATRPSPRTLAVAHIPIQWIPVTVHAIRSHCQIPRGVAHHAGVGHVGPQLRTTHRCTFSVHSVAPSYREDKASSELVDRGFSINVGVVMPADFEPI